jgi:predicted Zn-ribbon and HTH transcriptional regulator
MALPDILRRLVPLIPDAVLIDHSGSASAHPIVCDHASLIRRALRAAQIIYGGVFPTYHWQDILTDVLEIDVIVRGEGEMTAPRPDQCACCWNSASNHPRHCPSSKGQAPLPPQRPPCRKTLNAPALDES